ncbi:DUF6588 family protein [Luteirhabdus pelagi]|uniref:DUF6588 family protein n=1 Tax=Luteirhabdus pelagi TaxID=2792783 RepID=UPI00193A631A|nr:DUF6588 family protein [Luteirhabdus pelagi]
MKTKSLLFICTLVLTIYPSSAQENLEDILAAGVADAKRFASAYMGPGFDGAVHNTANGWVQSAEVKKPLKFDISVVGNASFIKEDQKSFLLDENDYNNLYFRNGPNAQGVATAFGENDPDILVYAEVTDPTGQFTEEVEFFLPQGLASADLNILPTAFLQARLGIFKATEVKFRYFPKIEREDVETGVLGFGLQHEFSQWLAPENTFPVALSGVIAYTNLSGNYDFTDDEIIDGDNQKFNVTQNSWLFQLQASTKMKIFNVYGGVGYVSGTSEFDVLGTYRVEAGIPLVENTATFTDPFSIDQKTSGLRASIGVSLRLAFFGLHADYNIAEYNTASVGVHFGI